MREILEAISTMMPMLIGLLGGFFLISGGDERVSGTVFWVFFGIAVSSLAASIVELVKTLRDLPKKTDTAEMKQKVDAIKTAVHEMAPALKSIEIRSEKIDAVATTMQAVDMQTRKIDTIATTLIRFDGMVQSSKGNVMRPDEMLAQMKAVYDERYELLKENQSLKVELLQIRAENRQLRKEKQAIEKRYNMLLEQTHPDDELEFEM